MPKVLEASTVDLIPEHPTLRGLKTVAQNCRGCSLYKHATQTVFGEGPAAATIAFVGEQPGNEEDKSGRPFVGPAGKLFDRALADAGIDRETTYITNVVKHFKFEERGKRRIHKKPGASEVEACRPWLEAEMFVIKPRVVVCLGATAAQSILGRAYRVTESRGTFVEHRLAPFVTATIHPSAILRAPDEAARHEEYRRFVADLKKIREWMAARGW